MFILDSLMISGIRGTLEVLARAAHEQSEEMLRRALLDAAVRFESGEIDEVELARIETRLLGGDDAAHAAPPEIDEAPQAAADSPAGMLTHVHALVRSPQRPVALALEGLPDAVEGLPGGGSVRLLEAGEGHWLVVSSVPACDYGEDALARGVRDVQWVAPRALAHEKVVGHFLCVPAVLPMQLFTLFESDARALERICEDRERMDRTLDRIAHHAEWGLRLIWDEQAAGKEPSHAPPGANGTEYLARKRELRDGMPRQRSHARRQAERVYAALAGEAAECRRHSDIEGAPGSPVLLDAAFLVPTRRGDAFRGTLRRHEDALRAAAIDVAFTGPWAPWNFA